MIFLLYLLISRAVRRNSQPGVTPCISEDEEEEQSPMEQAISFIEQEIVRNSTLTEALPSTSSSGRIFQCSFIQT